MKKYLNTVTGFFASQLNYIPMLFVVFTIYFGILNIEPDVKKFFLMGLVPFGLYLVRSYADKLYLFFLLHIFLCAVPVLGADNIIEKIFFMLLGCVMLVLSFYFKVAKKQKEESILFAAMTFILAVVAYFTARNGQDADNSRYIVALVILYILYYVSYQYMKGYVSYIENNEISNQNIPEKHIFKTSFSALAGFLILFTGFALLLVKGDFLADLIQKVGAVIKRFLTWLFQFAPEGMEQAGNEQKTADALENVGNLGGNPEPVYQLSPKIAELIDHIVTIGAYVIGITAVLLAAYGIFRAIIAAFKVKSHAGEEEEILIKDKVTKLPIRKKEKKEKEKQLRYDKKIRKMYADVIVNVTVHNKTDKQERERLLHKLHYRTPGEQCVNVKEPGVLKTLYEKARYSSYNVTKEDVRQMKDACSQEMKR